MNTSINSINPVNLITLRFFSDPAILKGIGSIRLAMFLNGFSNELKAFNIPLPDPESANGSYFDSLAVLLSSPAVLPERLSAALFTLEKAASPENHACLESIIQRRIPCVSLTGCSSADRALEIWFTHPEELLPFAPPVSPKFDEGGLAAPKSDEGGPASINSVNLINPVNSPSPPRSGRGIEGEVSPAVLPPVAPKSNEGESPIQNLRACFENAFMRFLPSAEA